MPNFWSRYPSDPEEFREVVREEPGITITVNHGRGEPVQLPTPPPGYEWCDITGGVTAGSWRTYRLWTRGLGYLRRGE